MLKIYDKAEIRSRIVELKNTMKESGITYYLITSEDYHGSEYVHPYFCNREYFSGFSGSAGSLLVSLEGESGVWTDSRYFLQAAQQLEDTGLKLFKMDTEGCPTIEEYLAACLKSGDKLGFDGRCVSTALGKKLAVLCEKKQAELKADAFLSDVVRKNRPAMPDNAVWCMNLDQAGKSVDEKLAEVRKAMKEAGCNVHVLSSLDDIMWLFNIRGCDVECSPVALSYSVIGEKTAHLFLRPGALTSEGLKEHLGDTAKLWEYDRFFELLPGILEADESDNLRVLADEKSCSYLLTKLISEQGEAVKGDLPTTMLKACKTKEEMKHIREAYLEDSAAVCRFLCWLDETIGKEELTEISVSDKLRGYREQVSDFLDLSFGTICGYGAHGAIVHYEASEETNIPLEQRSFVLIDSGGQYKRGTTDITRTVALGELTAEEKRCFTGVALGMLRLGDAVFPEGATGRNLDIKAREVLWSMGLDYGHGTGHGIGYVLNVHEGPQRINWQYRENVKEYGLHEGMLISDEPGFYLEGKFGARCESIVEVVLKEKTAYGTFLKFEYLTYVPLDLRAFDRSVMTDDDVKLLNAYHDAVREKLMPYMKSENEKKWLENATRKLV